jgi:hypothetical protein
MTPTQLDELEALAKAAPAGKWEIWTSNSWRRVFADQGREKVRVIEPIVHQDGQPDLLFGFAVGSWLENFTPEVALSLIAEVRRLQANEDRYQALCAVAYQLAGTMNAPVRFLDAFSDASCGELEARAKTDDLLPVRSDEVGSFLSDEGQEYREDAERYRWATSLEDNAETLYSAVMSCGPKAVKEINIEIDAAIDAAKETKC